MFPQYGRASGVAAYAGVGNAAIPTHGFLSHLHWTLVDAGGSDPDAEDPCPTVVLEAESTKETYAVWPYHFRAVYTVTAPSLRLRGWGICCQHRALQAVRLTIRTALCAPRSSAEAYTVSSPVLLHAFSCDA